MFVVVLSCLSLVGVGAACYDGGGGFTLANWPRCVEASGNISVYSGLSQDGQYVKLGLHAKGHTRGWSALGFAGNGGMKGASQIVVRIGNDDNWVAEDRYSLDYVTPTLDTKQDVQLLFAADNGMNTSWGVILPKDSCDIDDYSTENVSRTFLWALGASHAFNMHVTRGQFHANLISAIIPFAPLTGVTEVSLRMNATVVSASSDATNPYICGIFDLRQLIPGQNFSNKVHVAKFAPYLNPATSGYVHHMILYGCNSNNFTHGDIVPNCESMPAGCNAFKWVWAVGSQDIQFPDNVGMPIGEGDFFVALQMHYYNPALINVVDTSGVSFSVVNTPRAIDAGLMQLNGGTSPNMRPDLPPLTPTFTIPTFVVPATCTNTWAVPLNVIGAIHHMHLVGVHQEIEVSRGGVNLGPMRYERIYDFRHQSIEESLIGQLLPGDELRVTCQYDTSKKNVSTRFGESTDNEMCWSAVMYYPAQSFTTAAVQPVKTPEELWAEGAKCINASTTYAAQSLSLCTEIYDADPLSLLLGQSFPLDSLHLCNNFSVAAPASWAQLQQLFPEICPPCSADYNCTTPILLAHGQQVVCPIICNSLALSTYPDQTRRIVYNDHNTYCDGAASGLYRFNNTWPNRTCTPKGALNNSTAVSAIATPVLTTQNACPNAAIKNVLSRCAPADFANSCVEQCRTATLTLSAAFAAMAPAPSGDQKLKCVSDFNSTWAPNSTAGGVWTQWTVLDTRLRTGSVLCNETSSLSGAGQTLPWAVGVGSILLCLFN